MTPQTPDRCSDSTRTRGSGRGRGRGRDMGRRLLCRAEAMTRMRRAAMGGWGGGKGGDDGWCWCPTLS